jgi:FkbM family methyltransferase
MNVLKQNMALNSSHRIIPFQVAAGNRQGQVTFVDDGMHWIAKPVNGGCDSNGSKTVSINATTLDTVCSSNGIVPDIIKIDVEGYEFQVLQGGVQTLIESKPMLFIEIHPDLLAQHGISSVGIMEFLASKGYRFYDNSLAEVGIKHFSIDRVFRVICAHHVLS